MTQDARIRRKAKRIICCCALLMLVYGLAFGETELDAVFDRRIDNARGTRRVPSVSVAFVRDGHIIYAKAFGKADLASNRSADASTIYPIGSVTKQFIAAAVLLLQEAGQLSLEDEVDKYLPDFPHAKLVKIRNLLAHTSGYKDYAYQDYLLSEWTIPITVPNLLAQAGNKPLEFRPGTRWQYSNTNYSIAGAIVEKASGVPLHKYLTEKIFGPLQMKTAGPCSARSPGRATGYVRHALGPSRPAGVEAPYWGFGAYDLCMTPSDLARWNIALMQSRVLSTHSFRELTKEALLDNGDGTKYAMGLDLGAFQGLREISHEGSVIGAGCINRAFPEVSAAVTACENLGNNSDLSEHVAEMAAELIVSVQRQPAEEEVRSIRDFLTGLRSGRVDGKVLTPNARSYFDETVRGDYRKSLAELGKLLLLTPVAEETLSGMTRRVYRAEFDTEQAIINVFVTPNGSYEQFMIFRR